MRNYIFNEKISLKPNKITKFNEVCYTSDADDLVHSIHEGCTRINAVKQFHRFQISPAAKRNITEKVNWLYLLGKSRYMKTYSGKEIFNFKINFLTLTLPSMQQHPTAQITSECFNQFLTEIRQRVKMENYIWRLEFQRNGNVHYHIVTDCFIDYFLAQKIWNRIVNKLGYVDAYTAKFSKMSLQEYIENSSAAAGTPFDVQAKRYAKGKACSWKEPRSVDVKVCTSDASIAYYISKYFSKEKDNNTLCNRFDNEENSFSLRLWFCSRSLSKLKSICDYSCQMPINWHTLLKGKLKVRNIVLDYADCLFFELREMSNEIKSLLYPIYRKYANELQYNSA